MTSEREASASSPGHDWSKGRLVSREEGVLGWLIAMSSVAGHSASAAALGNTVSGLQSSSRSTRGASKQRRDQINVEIQKLRDLLPLSDSIKDRLFQLQVMSLACIFIRKHRYLMEEAMRQSSSLSICSRPPPRHLDTCKALRGFLLMVTRTGKMLYISENASEYLGHSVEEIMCQGDSVYDLVDPRDHAAVQAELLSGPPMEASGRFPDERVFICRMNLSRTAKRQLQYHKFVLVEGRYVHPAETYQRVLAVPGGGLCMQPVFAAYCQPLINPENAELLSNGNTRMFRSLHLMDMQFLHLDDIGVFHLGYENDDLTGKSWYRYVHPNDLVDVYRKHKLLCQEKEGSVICLVRLQTTRGDWLWLHTVLAVKGNVVQPPSDGRRVRHLIHATYQRLSELEAATLQANAWIYEQKRSCTEVFASNKSTDECSSSVSPPAFLIEQGLGLVTSPLSPLEKLDSIKAEPILLPKLELLKADLIEPCKQISVEIPTKRVNGREFGLQSNVALSTILTPEHSSPDSNNSNGRPPDLLEHIDQLYKRDTKELPELRDDLDDFFCGIECPPLFDVLTDSHKSSTNSPPDDVTSSTTAAVTNSTSTPDLDRFGGHHCYANVLLSPPRKRAWQEKEHLTTKRSDNSRRGGGTITGQHHHRSSDASESDMFYSTVHPRIQNRVGSWAGV